MWGSGGGASGPARAAALVRSAGPRDAAAAAGIAGGAALANAAAVGRGDWSSTAMGGVPGMFGGAAPGASRSVLQRREAGSVERVAAAGVFGGAGRVVAGVGGVVTAAAVGGGVARGAYRLLSARPPGGSVRWTRKNNRGRELTLLEGPALAVGIGAAALLVPGLPGTLRLAGCGAALGAGAVGLYDDLSERGAAKGLRGHLSALARGEVTTGAVKILGIGATGLAAGAAIRRDPLDRVLAGLVVAGAANVVNLFDLRPGRAVKAATLGSGAAVLREAFAAEPGPRAGLLTAAALGAAAALLPEDLGEAAMLGDCGANALGAVLGVAAASRASRARLVGLAAGLAALTAASEKISFTKVIAATPALRRLDEWGRDG